MENKKDPWTLQQKFGFQDDDLKSPKHDDIMVWLDTNIERIFKERFIKYFIAEWNESVEKTKKTVGDISGYSENVLPGEIQIKKIWEMPIVNKNYTIGFIDFVISFEYPKLLCTNQYRSIVQEAYIDWKMDSFAFEVKTVIPSVGELIRQIRMYQTYFNYTFYVVAPDDKYEQVLKSQNIGFVKYTG